MTNKKRAVGFLNAYTKGKSGGDVVFLEIAKGLKRYHWQIVTSYLGKRFCWQGGLKGNFFLTTKEKSFERLLVTYSGRILRGIFWSFRAPSFSLILSSSDFLPDVLPAFILKKRFPDSFWVQHIFHLLSSSSNRLAYLGQKLSFFFIKRKADLIVVDNCLLKDELIRQGFSSQKVTVNYPGLKKDDFQERKAPKGFLYDGLFLGRIKKSKGVLELPRLWSRVVKKVPQARLAIIGKGDEQIERKLKQMIVRHHLSKNISLLGFLSDKKVKETMKTSRLFIFPSFQEGFGLAPLEAQAYSLPVVVWNLPVYEEVFPGGMVKIPLGNIPQMAQKIVYLIRNEKEREKLSRRAYQNARRFSWSAAAKREEELIKKYSHETA